MNTEENITKKTAVNTEENVNSKEGTCTEGDIISTVETCTEGNICGCGCDQVLTDDNSPKEEIDRDVINDLMSIFDDVECAYPLNDVMAELRKLGYDNPGVVVTLALQDDLIYVDSVEDGGIVYIATVDQDDTVDQDEEE